MLWVLANYANHSGSLDNFAFVANLFNAGSHFHFVSRLQNRVVNPRSTPRVARRCIRRPTQEWMIPWQLAIAQGEGAVRGPESLILAPRLRFETHERSRQLKVVTVRVTKMIQAASIPARFNLVLFARNQKRTKTITPPPAATPFQTPSTVCPPPAATPFQTPSTVCGLN